MEPGNVAIMIGMIEQAWSVVGFNIMQPTWKPSLRTFILVAYFAYQPYISITAMVNYHQELDVLSECISVTTAGFQVFIRIIVFYYYKPVLIEMIEFLRTQRKLFKPDSRIHALQDQFIARTIFFIKCLRILYRSTILFVLIPLVIPDPKKYNLPLAFHLPHIPPDQTPYYQLNYLYHIIGLLQAQQFFFGADALIVITVMGACAQIGALKLTVQNLGSSDGTDDALLDSIRIHMAIKDYIAMMKRMLRLHLFIIFGSVCIVLCLSLNVIVLDYRTAMYFFLTSALFQLFVTCYSGNLLLIENDTLSNYVYSINWPDMPRSRQQVVLFLLANAQPDVQLDGIFMPLNMESFLSVIKASYSYFTILN